MKWSLSLCGSSDEELGNLADIWLNICDDRTETHLPLPSQSSLAKKEVLRCPKVVGPPTLISLS